MKTTEELRNYLLNNCVDEYGNLVLNDLDFSDFEGDVEINCMKVRGSLFQSRYVVKGSLFQHSQVVNGNLHQSRQEVQGNLYNENNKYGGRLFENPSTKILKDITAEELAKLGYKLKGDK